MAGEWIKVEAATADKPEVLRIARILKLDHDTVFGKLVRLWSWIDTNSVDGVVDGVVDADLDCICRCAGFTSACVAVGWLQYDASAERVSLPNFDRHNGETAKQRDMKNRRQAKWRAGVDDPVDEPSSTKASTREEKRREEKKKEKKPAARPLSAYIEECKVKGEKPIPDGDPIFDYAEKVGLPHDYLLLAWGWFKDQMEGKRKTDWRAHFRNAVKGNWPKYWYPTDDGGWRLSPAGEQARRASA
jgi:hypothetical protein